MVQNDGINNNSSDEDLDKQDRIHQAQQQSEDEAAQEAQGTEAGPEQSAELTAAQSRYANRRPAVDEDLFQRQLGGRIDNPLEAVVTASDDPKEYLVRSYLTDREIRLILLQNSQTSGVLLGFVNPGADNVMLMHMVRSGPGKANAMQQYERMYVGKRVADREMAQQHFLNRFSTLGNEQVEVRQPGQ